MMDVEKAKQELQQKTLQQIQRDTALSWGARTMAVIEFSDQAKSQTELLHWMVDAHEYYHEALEHGALVDEPGFFDNLKKEINFPAKY